MGPSKLFILNLLLKTHLLVPNLWLYDLAFMIYGPESLKFGDFFVRKSDTEGISRLFLPPKHLLNHYIFALILFYTLWASFWYLIHACGRDEYLSRLSRYHAISIKSRKIAKFPKVCIILHNYSITGNICIIEYTLHKIAYLVKQFKKTTYFGTKNDLFRYKKRLIWVQKTTYFGTKNDLFRYKKGVTWPLLSVHV